jgi:hypothetical protein
LTVIGIAGTVALKVGKGDGIPFTDTTMFIWGVSRFGTVTVMDVLDQDRMSVTVAEPNITVFVGRGSPKSLPVIVTVSPGAAVGGDNLVMLCALIRYPGAKKAVRRTKDAICPENPTRHNVHLELLTLHLPQRQMRWAIGSKWLQLETEVFQDWKDRAKTAAGGHPTNFN